MDLVCSAGSATQMLFRRRNVAIVVALFMLSTLLCTATDLRLTFGFPWGDGHPYIDGLKAAAELLEKDHGIVLDIQAGYNTDKLTVAIAAGVPPDVVQRGVGEILSNAVSGILMPLEPFLEKHRINLLNDFFPAALPLLQWNNSTYALHWVPDINFLFMKNHEILQEAGIDPLQEILYTDQVDTIAQRVSQMSSEGTASRVGFVPWAAGEPANALLTWGLAFGGSFYDLDQGVFTTDKPENIAALEWIVSYKSNGWVPTGASMDPASGRVALGFAWPAVIMTIKGRSERFDFSLAPIPHKKDGGNPNPVWVGGPCLALPTGAKHPDEAFQVIDFLIRDPVGSVAFAKTANVFPAYRKSPYLRQIMDDPDWRPLFEQSLAVKYSRPPVPNSVFWIRAGNAAVNRALAGMEPANSLRQMQHEVTVDLQELLKGLASR